MIPFFRENLAELKKAEIIKIRAVVKSGRGTFRLVNGCEPEGMEWEGGSLGRVLGGPWAAS